MPSVCFYFQVHQPFRVNPKIGMELDSSNNSLFDEAANAAIMQKVAKKCYLPMNNLLLELIKQHGEKFKVSFSITGVAIEQMKLYSPETLDSFIKLAETGCVEFLGETYYHSLAALYDETEFQEQVLRQSALMKMYFGQTPQVFRNTELIYDNKIGELVAKLGFKGVIAEGVDDVLKWRSPNYLYQVPGTELPILLKNYKLSDDIAFRFSNRGWEEYPLTTDKFASWLHAIDGAGEVVNLFMDYETFGEHQWAESGIFDFMRHLPEALLKKPGWSFNTPSEVVKKYKPISELSFHRLTSWADMERDLTAWRGNTMQNRALKEAFTLADIVKQTRNPQILSNWRKLLTSDHFYYMCTKWFSDGDVHAYFSPFESPYEAFISYMAVVGKVVEGLRSVEGVELRDGG